MGLRRGASITEILTILGAIALLIAILSYGMGWLNSGNKQANKLSEGSNKLLENTVDKMTAETFLNSLTFVWDVYEVSSGKKVTSSSGSWNDIKAVVENYAESGKISSVITGADTTAPTPGPGGISATINLDPYKSMKATDLPFGYEAVYNILKANPNKNIYIVVGKTTDKYQIVIQTAYYETS